ncbi:MAG: hypothetical protein ABR584_12045 [Candidatus Baltobacteraceae bacterium]
MDPFEQSADMRLLELQRKALGKEPPRPSNWSASSVDMHEGIPVAETPIPELSGARLFVDLIANPKAKLVPGAVLTVSLALQNAGDRPAEDVNISVPIPGETAYRPGSLLIDDRTASVSYADALFGEGFVVEQLAPGQRMGFVWKISVERGVSSIVVTPRVSSKNAAVIGAASTLLSRGKPATSPTLPEQYTPSAQEIERPFYELDETEEQSLDKEFPSSPGLPFAEAPLPVMPDVLPAEAPAESTVQPVVEELQPLPDPAPQPASVVEAPRLYCIFDASSLATVKKLFAADSFGQVPHFILQNSLACSLAAMGVDTGLRTHFSQQAGMLSRALLMRKLGKPMNPADYSTGKTGFPLDATAQVAPESAPSPLYMALTPAEAEFCAAGAERNHLESFIRIRQLAVTLQARYVAVKDEHLRSQIEQLLSDYATAARAAINRIFIRAKLDKNFDPMAAAVDPATDKLAHALIDSLERVIAI